MSKRHRDTRGVVQGKDGKPVAFQQKEIIDDNFLPESDELQKLQALDPNIIEWIKKRTELEQNGRLDFNDRKLKLYEDGARRNFQMDILIIISAVIVILASMGASVFFIINGQQITGTVFAGGTMILAVNAILNFRKKIASEK